MTTAPDRAPHYVQSLARGLSVIRAFDARTPEMTLSDVSRSTGLTRAAARRFLLTLVDLGYVRFDGKMFKLAPRVLSLGYAYLSSLPLAGIAEPYLEGLARETHESSSLCELDGDEIVYTARIATSRIMTVDINVGTRFPAYATSMGRVLLAGLEDAALGEYLAHVDLVQLTKNTVSTVEDLHASVLHVRAAGFALVDQELEEGLRSIAVPVHDKKRRVIAAVNVSSHVSRTSKDKARRQFLPMLLQASNCIESDLARI